MKTLFASVLSAILLTACGQTVQEAPSSDPKVENQRITFPEKSSQLSSLNSITVENSTRNIAYSNDFCTTVKCEFSGK